MLLQHSSLKEPNFERFNLLSLKRVNKCVGGGAARRCPAGCAAGPCAGTWPTSLLLGSPRGFLPCLP